jgi:hypothetical protein
LAIIARIDSGPIATDNELPIIASTEIALTVKQHRSIIPSVERYMSVDHNRMCCFNAMSKRVRVIRLVRKPKENLVL